MSYIKDGESHLSGGRSSSMNHDVSQQIYDNFYRLGNRYRDQRQKLLAQIITGRVVAQTALRW
jgi:hypothetical protein